MTDPAGIVAAAHDYRRRNWRVIHLHKVGPDGVTCSCGKGAKCPSKGKHPVDNGWQNTPPLSAPDIEALWAKWPKSNVGIATGDASGFWVLDIDPKSGGMEAMTALVAENGRLPQTFTVRTGSGGLHYYFAMPDFPVTNSPGSLKGTGVDVRGSGGQVVAAPSRTDKGDYSIMVDAAVAPAPAWLLELIRPVAPTGPVVTSSDVPDRSHLPESEQIRLDRYCEKAVSANLDRVRKLKDSGWDGEPWNNTTYEVACSLIEIANSGWNVYTLQKAFEDLILSTPRDSEGFDDEAVKKCWQSAVAKVGNKARAVPEGPKRDDDLPDFFNGPEVRRSPKDQPGSPDPGERPATGGPYTPEMFFDGKQPDYERLASAIMAEEPVAYGADNSFWVYREGVWRSSPGIVQSRCVRLLRGKVRREHVGNAKMVVQEHAQYLECGPVRDYVNFQNGMLEWGRGDALVPHDPAFGSTVQMATHWDPDAECPEFDGFLEGILSPDYVKLAWEMIGYMMLSGNPLQVAFLLYGTGGNGKGTLIRVIQELLGQGSISAQSLDQLNGSRFAAVNLFGKTANIAGDIDGTYQESTANFKKLTGEDIYSAERKFGEPFNFTSWAVPIFSANKIPGSSDVSEGYLRRWVMLEFNRRITRDEKVDGLSDLLLHEAPGIAAHGVRSLRVLMQRRYFDLSGDAAHGREKFAQAIDQVRVWAREGAVAAPEHFEPTTALYADYVSWAARNGRHGKLSSTEFAHRLEAIGFKPARQGMPGYVGLMVSGTSAINHVHPTGSVDTFFEGDSRA